MKEFINQLSNKFKSAYLIWIIFNFILMMLGGGFFSSHIFLRYDSDFFPFSKHFFLSNYDYTEFLIYTTSPILLYYAYHLWFKK